MSEKKNYIIIGVVVLLCIFAGWLYADHHRNDDIRDNTDSTVADIDRRIKGIEDRLDSVSARLDANQKTISGIAERVDRSRENAETIANGIGIAEDRLDQAIARSQRIEDIIQQIENANRPGTQSASQTTMAK